MRRSLPFLLAGLIALVAQPAWANQIVVRGTVPHHHHFFFRHHPRFFSISQNPFFLSTSPFLTPTPFLMSTPFPTATPFVFDGGVFPIWGWTSGAGFGVPVALGGGGEFPEGASAEPRIIVVAAPFNGPAPGRAAEPAHATVEETPSGVTIIRGSGTRR